MKRDVANEMVVADEVVRVVRFLSRPVSISEVSKVDRQLSLRTQHDN